MAQRTYLDVVFSQKERVKALGALWDPTIRSWYVPEGVRLEPFSAWIPDLTPSIRCHGTIYFVESPTSCYQCDCDTTAVTLAADGVIDLKTGELFESFYLFSFVSMLPDSFRGKLQRRYRLYYKDYSKTMEQRYFLNHCPCGAKYGDFYLYSEPGSAFCPINKKQARAITITPIANERDLELCASFDDTREDLIFRYAKRIEPICK